MSELKGNFTLVLHAHLPYVLSHGRWPHGTDWLNEATAETYIPLLRVFERLIDEGITPNVTLGLTPILCEQLANPSFWDEFNHYCENKIKASQEDIIEFEKLGDDRKADLAIMWREFYSGVQDDFNNRFDKNLVAAFARLQEQGAIEIITCAATHGYLPLLGSDESVKAQVRTGVETYKKHFNRQPAGIWLPECAYRPAYKWAYPIEDAGQPFDRLGVEEVLYDNGLAYFMVDHHLLEGGKAIGAYAARFEGLLKIWQAFSDQYQQAGRDKKSPGSVYLVSSKAEKGKATAILVRDPKTCLQVWSGQYGYPGDGNYLDVHKKHYPSGNRYWRVTDPQADLGDKLEYNPEKIEARLDENAEHFAKLIAKVVAENNNATGKTSVLCAPFDAELFGHWWFEGPGFLYKVIKNLHKDKTVGMVTGQQQMELSPPREVISIPEGSWGEGGYHFIWLNEFTQWTWKHIYESEKSFAKRVGSKFYESDQVGQGLCGKSILLAYRNPEKAY